MTMTAMTKTGMIRDGNPIQISVGRAFTGAIRVISGTGIET